MDTKSTPAVDEDGDETMFEADDHQLFKNAPTIKNESTTNPDNAKIIELKAQLAEIKAAAEIASTSTSIHLIFCLPHWTSTNIR